MIIVFLSIFKKNNIIRKVINEPILPYFKEEYSTKHYNKSHYNLTHPRYHFQEKYDKRKKFKINYSYYPYTKITKSLSFQDNAKIIYDSTGMLNITKLDYYYKNENKYKFNLQTFNQIHLSMAMDKNLTDLALISIASILDTSKFDTYIHFHILGLDFDYVEIEKIIYLKKINNKVEFIFYNAKQAEYDFEKGADDVRGFGNYAKILIPQIVNNTNKILILDSGDILCQKDLSEIYFYDIGNNYFGWIIDSCAGNINITEDKFMTNNYHPNTGVVLVNIRLFRQDELYKKSVFVGKSYHYFKSPTQDILITVANYKFKYIPLNFNLRLYFRNETEKLKKIRIPTVERWLRIQRFTPYKYSLNEIFEAMYDPVVQHFYLNKIPDKNQCDKYVLQWIKYAKLSGIYKRIKKKYPKPFRCEKKKRNIFF